ncbi:MAG: hypothetical protein LBB75_09325 [Oscillospiraceae bacterium]|jgi:hypothetical protein|nr:hypothetical protein [Oscillospiraceae bacterium]
MQKSNWPAVVGCLIVGAGIAIAGLSIGGAIRDQSFYSVVPGSFEVYNQEGFSPGYLDEGLAAAYLGLPREIFDAYLQSGKLDGAFARIELPPKEGAGTADFGYLYLFSKEKLDAFMLGLMEAGG